MQGVSEMCGTR